LRSARDRSLGKRRGRESIRGETSPNERMQLTGPACWFSEAAVVATGPATDPGRSAARAGRVRPREIDWVRPPPTVRHFP